MQKIEEEVRELLKKEGVKLIDFKWPEKEELKILLKDILEAAPKEWYEELEELRKHPWSEIYQGDETYGEHASELESQIKLREVDEKYYLSEAHVKRLLTSTDLQKKFSQINPEIAGTMTARQFANWKGTFIAGNINPSGRGQNGNVHGGDIGPTITTNKGEGPKIIQLNNPKHSTNRVYSTNGVGRCLRGSAGGLGAKTGAYIVQRPRGFNKGGLKTECPTIGSNYWQQNNFLLDNFTIRKLTPKECFRLQGFLNDEVNLEGISDTQRYKLAGNGQSVNVVKKIFKEMFHV